ncbi:FmdB family zinc ribbon protein [Curvibacter lanceolatus]|uniref:FmdB family zinc ribbon protein n=1 Tax=Curvibacter lanceolatus TaxID=86182 RepID=UPI000367E490|nr:zinc ribbon domain-containing protein [Curvibacter lanceolatus]
MPLYDYHCPACGHRFEALVRAGSTPACPQCGSSALERQISAPVPPGQSKAIIASARRQVAREGHLSNFSKAERGKLG